MPRLWCHERRIAIPVIGQGRIVVWEGAALWVLEGDKTADLRPHAHHAIQITFLLKGWFELNVGGEKLEVPSLPLRPTPAMTFERAVPSHSCSLPPRVQRALGSATCCSQNGLGPPSHTVHCLTRLRLCATSSTRAAPRKSFGA